MSLSSRERMLAAIAGSEPDHVPCAFMLFFNLYERCRSEAEYVEKDGAKVLAAGRGLWGGVSRPRSGPCLRPWPGTAVCPPGG